MPILGYSYWWEIVYTGYHDVIMKVLGQPVVTFHDVKFFSYNFKVFFAQILSFSARKIANEGLDEEEQNNISKERYLQGNTAQDTLCCTLTPC